MEFKTRFHTGGQITKGQSDEFNAMGNGEAIFQPFGIDTRSIRWSSKLPRSDVINLQAALTDKYRETWGFTASPSWHVEFNGMAQVLSIPEHFSVSEYWTIEFRPRPGDQLTVNITRPEAVPGETLAIDLVDVRETIGKRARTSELNFSYRSTQGGLTYTQRRASA